MHKMTDKDRSSPGVNMLKSILALWYLCDNSKKNGKKCGYEKLVAVAPKSLFTMSEFFIRRMSVNNSFLAKEIGDLKKNPQKYLDSIERATAFHRQELALFRQGKISQYTPEMYERDTSLGRCGISSHYLSRKIIIDRCIRDAITNGFTQIVIPACGLDTAAERYAKEHPDVNFYLSDLPDIMRERLDLEDNEFRIIFFGSEEQLANLHFDIADLKEPENLTDILASAERFDREKKTLYIFEGVSMYLTPNSIRQLFHDINITTPEHEIIIGLMFHSTDAEMLTVKGTYKNKAVLPYYKIQKEFIRGDSSHPAYSIKGLSALDGVVDGLVDWDTVNADYIGRHGDSDLTTEDLRIALMAFEITAGNFLLAP
jgi:O-methyltransferase involved in polyketide biosynthesis